MNKAEYKDIFVFVEQHEGAVQPIALELIGKARELASTLGEEVVALFAGTGIKDSCQTLIEYGADRVIYVDAPELKEYLTEQYTQAVSQILAEHKPNIVLIGATHTGRDLAPRISARLATGLTADCTKLEISEDGDMLMTRPAFGGNLMATIKCGEHRPQMSTVRAGVMQRVEPDKGRKGEVVEFKPKFDSSKFRVKHIETVRHEKEMVDIAKAKILVAGGRGVGTKDGFGKLNALANVLHAEVASSRAMVDAGVLEPTRQVGQTGKTVRPDLYFAIGISGAIQHVSGMEESEYIVAINKDKLAPIFNVADLGIVGDLHTILPLLTDRLEKVMADHKG